MCVATPDDLYVRPCMGLAVGNAAELRDGNGLLDPNSQARAAGSGTGVHLIELFTAREIQDVQR